MKPLGVEKENALHVALLVETCSQIVIKKLGFQKVRMDHSSALTKYEPMVSHGGPV